MASTMHGYSSSTKAGEVTTPDYAIIMWWKNDVAVELANADFDLLECGVPDHQMELLEASHWVQVDAPEAVNKVMLTFLRRHLNRAGRNCYVVSIALSDQVPIGIS